MTFLFTDGRLISAVRCDEPMTGTDSAYGGKLAVLYEGQGDLSIYRQLSERLAVPLRNSREPDVDAQETFFLSWREGCLKLMDKELVRSGGLTVDIEPRSGEQRSWPAPKQGPLAQALGRKTRTVVDATTGWGQDALHIFRMGYELVCVERSPVMAELLADGLERLMKLDWMQRLGLTPPKLMQGDAIEILADLDIKPDCVYLDPMFPPKRKKSALAKKSMRILQELLGGDEDRDQLFEAAFNAAAKRVVVKRPDHAEPLGGKPSESIQGKLLRYDVYIKN